MIGIGVAIYLYVRESSSADPGEENPGTGEEEEEGEENPGTGEEEEEKEPSELTKDFGSFNNLETITLTNYSAGGRIKTIVLFQIPDNALEITELRVQFNRQHVAPTYSANYDFQYLLFDIRDDKNEKSVFDANWTNCEDKQWENDNDCKSRVLHDFTSAEGFDYKFTSADLTFDENSTSLSNEPFLEKLKGGYWLKLLMRISGNKHSGELSNIRGTLTYRV